MRSPTILLVIALFASSAISLRTAPRARRCRHDVVRPAATTNRVFAPLVAAVAAASLIVGPGSNAYAGIDPAQLQKFTETQAALDGADIPYEALPSGVSYREFRSGRGERTVAAGKTVTCRLTARAKVLNTPKDIGGVKYYASQVDAEEKDAEGKGVLTWTFGSPESPVPAGLEEAMVGMKRGAIRRVDIPSVLVYRARKDGRLPLPAEKSTEEQRIVSKLFKTKGDSIFEVLVEKIAE
jgi:hypothetical protein